MPVSTVALEIDFPQNASLLRWKGCKDDSGISGTKCAQCWIYVIYNIII